ncbi:MAG TPA: hypothetical protein VII28_06465 [Puia sp.]
MCKANPSVSIILLISTVFFAAISCSKEMSSSGGSTSTGNTTTSTSGTIVVATGSSGADSVYILQQCEIGYFRDSVAATALPDSITAYLTANYTGYVFEKAYEIKDSAATIGGYVVIISFNSKPVGLLFDASGNFQRVLEQREGGDIHGEGWHHGGRFDDRDGSHRDTVMLSALPSAITSYLASNDPSDTLIRAYQNRDSSYLVITKNNGLFANLFSASGDFIKRVSLMPAGFSSNHPDSQNVAQDSLPAGGLSLLTTIFPNYVFESAVSFSLNGQLQGYAVVIDANNTKYAVWFDASGNLLAVLPIW